MKLIDRLQNEIDFITCLKMIQNLLLKDQVFDLFFVVENNRNVDHISFNDFVKKSPDLSLLDFYRFYFTCRKKNEIIQGMSLVVAEINPNEIILDHYPILEEETISINLN